MIDESTARRILGSYGLRGPAVEWVRPLVGGTTGTSVRVRAERQDWVLKAHKSPQATSRLGISQALEVRLAEAGYPVAPLRHSESGDTLVTDGRAHYSLHGWVDGQHVTIDNRDRLLSARPAFLSEIGTALANLHRIAGSLGPAAEDLRVATFRGRALAPQRIVTDLQRVRVPRPSPWRSLRLRRRKSAFDNWAIQSFPALAHEAERLARLSRDSPSGSSEVIVIHNDLNWENLVLDQELALRAVLDFDNVTRAPRELELGAAAVVLAGTEPERVEELVSAYEDAAQLATDRSAVVLAMRLKCAQSLAFSLRTYLTSGVPDTNRLEAWCQDLHHSLQMLNGR